MAATTILTVSNLAKTFITEEIFSGVTFQVAEREHVALVGVNGAGKSTVLRIIAGIEHANGGEIVQAAGLRITYLAQESSFTSTIPCGRKLVRPSRTCLRLPTECARSSMAWPMPVMGSTTS